MQSAPKQDAQVGVEPVARVDEVLVGRAGARSSCPGPRGARTRGCRPGARARISLSRSTFSLLERGPLDPDPDGRSAVEDELGPRDLHGDDLGLVVAQVEASLDADDRVLLEQRGRTSVIVFGNTMTSSAAPRSSSTNVAMRSPRFGVLARQRGHDPADDAHLAFAQLLELGQRALDVPAQRALGAHAAGAR